MSNEEHLDTMECLQMGGGAIKFFVRRRGAPGNGKAFFSRVIAEEYARQNGLIVEARFV